MLDFFLTPEEQQYLDRAAAGNGGLGELMRALQVQRRGLLQEIRPAQIRGLLEYVADHPNGAVPTTLRGLAERLAQAAGLDLDWTEDQGG